MRATILDAGLDYLTATTTPRMPQHTEFDEAAQSWFADAVCCGFNVKEARNKGYEGLKLDGTFYGKREDSSLWETSGPISNEVARYLRERGVMPRITRADFQVTHTVGEVAPDWASAKLEDARAWAQVNRRAFKPTVGHFKNFGSDTGFTLGRRGSQAYFRTYLAGQKHKERYDSTAIRDESEFRGARAIDLFAMHQQARDPAAYSMGVVRTHMERKHLFEWWHCDSDLAEFPPLCYDASEERSLLWVENHVCPVIERLANGPHRSRIIAALQRACEYRPKESQQMAKLEA